MTPREPSRVLVVDANIVVSMALGLRSRRSINAVSQRRDLIISERARAEVFGRVSDPRFGSETAVESAASALSLIGIVSEAVYGEFLPAAARALRNAVASRNGSERDAHVLALAWTLDADIWSHDRDFAGAGWPSWSSANLLESLEQA